MKRHLLGRKAALWAGCGLLAHYGLHLAHGINTGQVLWDAMHTPLGRVDGLLFASAFGAVDVALLGGVYARRRGGPAAPPRWLHWLGHTGAAFAVSAFLASLVGLVGFLAGRMIPFAFPAACLCMFVSALLLGLAALRTRTLPSWAARTLVAFALVTAPLGFALPVLLDGLPVYVSFELHFVFAGLAWLALARALPTGNNDVPTARTAYSPG